MEQVTYTHKAWLGFCPVYVAHHPELDFEMIERREDAIGESGKPMAKALLFVPVGGAGDLIEAAKPFVRQVGDQRK